MVLGSQGDNAMQAIIDNGRYIPIDIKANYEDSPKTDEIISRYIGRASGPGRGQYGYKLWSTAKPHMQSWVEHIAHMGTRANILPCFDKFPGTEVEKQVTVNEILRRMQMMPEVLQEMKRQRLA
jgi:hypothetical protein